MKEKSNEQKITSLFVILAAIALALLFRPQLGVLGFFLEMISAWLLTKLVFEYFIMKQIAATPVKSQLLFFVLMGIMFILMQFMEMGIFSSGLDRILDRASEYNGFFLGLGVALISEAFKLSKRIGSSK